MFGWDLISQGSLVSVIITTNRDSTSIQHYITTKDRMWHQYAVLSTIRTIKFSQRTSALLHMCGPLCPPYTTRATRRAESSQAAPRASLCCVWGCSSRATSRANRLVARQVKIRLFQKFGSAYGAASVVCGTSRAYGHFLYPISWISCYI